MLLIRNHFLFVIILISIMCEIVLCKTTSYHDSVFGKSINRKLNHPFNNNYVFIDHKKEYGIRFDPNKKNEQKFDEEYDDIQLEIDSTPSIDMTTDYFAETVTTTSAPPPLTNASMSHSFPSFPIRETLNIVRERFKDWVSRAIGFTAPLVGGRGLLSLFNIIKFENSECTSSDETYSGISGTCYHNYECTSMGGTVIDTCAEELGVCCVCKHS